MEQQEKVFGSPEDAAAFCAKLEELEMTMAELVRTMIRHGDNRSAEVIRCNLQRVAAGTSRYSGELRAMMGMMARTKKLRMRRAEMKRAALQAETRECSPRDQAG